MRVGARLATGRTAEILALPETPDRVLKLFLAGVPAADVAAERERTAVAADAGLTSVRCHAQVRIGDRDGLVLDRLDGVSLTKVGERNPLRIRQTARELARLQARMHAVAAPGLPDVRAVVRDLLDAPPLAFLGAAERAAAEALVAALPGGDRLLHLDFHPENVFATPGGPVIIDWQTALRGAPAADVAASTFLLVEAELWPGTPRLKELAFGLVRRTFHRAWLGEYRAQTGIADAEIARWRVPALVLRLGWDIEGERAQLQAALRRALR